MTLFYCPTLETASVLSEEESQHAVKVLRLEIGDKIIVVDGKGGFYEAEITFAHHKKCEFKILSGQQKFGKQNYHLHIAIAPTKNIERLEWFIEKAVEIGINEITPIVCRFSERKIIKEDRLEKIIVSAAKQSIKAYFPVLNPLCSFDEFLKKYTAQQKFIAHCYETDKKLLKTEILQGSDVLILIGPEGDFSQEEVLKSLELGFLPVSLGESRLRTETAGVIACHTVQLINQAIS
jgi:16S rRNA (uracil1498-N3)-methyltransferase